MNITLSARERVYTYIYGCVVISYRFTLLIDNMFFYPSVIRLDDIYYVRYLEPLAPYNFKS